MLKAHKNLTDMLKHASLNHWFKYRGVSFLDLYDVLTKLTHIHRIEEHWHVMPFVRNERFTMYFTESLKQSLQAKKNYLIIPAATENHWTMILISHRERLIEYWDSRGQNNSLKHPWVQFRLKVAMSLIQAHLKRTYQVKSVVSICHQYRDCNCGLYAIRFMEEKMRGRSSKAIVRDLSYDIESVKSRYHHIRCNSMELIKKAPRIYQNDRFKTLPQVKKISWYQQLKLIVLFNLPTLTK